MGRICYGGEAFEEFGLGRFERRKSGVNDDDEVFGDVRVNLHQIRGETRLQSVLLGEGCLAVLIEANFPDENSVHFEIVSGLPAEVVEELLKSLLEVVENGQRTEEEGDVEDSDD